MTAIKPKVKSKTSEKRPAKRKTRKNEVLADDPNAIHDVYNEDNLDPAYDKTMGDDVAYDRDDKPKKKIK